MGADDITRRLRLRREELGASLAELAGWSGLPAARLAEIEQGAPLDMAEFERICIGLGVEPTAFYRARESEPRRSVARFRTAAATGADLRPEDLRVLALASEAGRILAPFLARSGRSACLDTARRTEAVGRKGEPFRQGYTLGARAREALGPGPGPILDVEAHFNALGIHVARVAFSSETIEAASLWEPGAAPIILLNRRSTRVRTARSRRAVLAHELCHLLHDGSGEGELATRVSWETVPGSYGEAIEQRARGFAPSYLAPTRAVKEWFATLAKEPGRRDEDVVRALAEHWGLSFEGAVWHAKNTTIIAGGVADRLVRSGPSLDTEAELDERFEPGARQPMRSTPLVDELAAEAADLWNGWALTVLADAVTTGDISLGRAMEIASWG